MKIVGADHNHHHHTRIYSAPITVIGHRCITESSELSANTESQTKKCVLSRFLKIPGSVTARKSFGSEFHADGPTYMKARSPNVVHNRGREKSDNDKDRRPQRGQPQSTGLTTLAR